MVHLARAGSHVTIYVLPSAPALHHFGPVARADIRQESSVLLWSRLLLIPLMLLVVLFEFKVYRQRRLVKHGTAASAIVSSIEHRVLWWYYVRCTSPTLPVSQTWEFCLSLWRAAEMPVGSSVTILYDSDHSEHAIHYDRRLFVEVFEPEPGLRVRLEGMAAVWRTATRGYKLS